MGMITKMIAARLIMGAIKRSGQKRRSRMAPTPVRKLYLPVNIPARVAEQTGLDIALVKRTPLLSNFRMFGTAAVSWWSS